MSTSEDNAFVREKNKRQCVMALTYNAMLYFSFTCDRAKQLLVLLLRGTLFCPSVPYHILLAKRYSIMDILESGA